MPKSTASRGTGILMMLMVVTGRQSLLAADKLPSTPQQQAVAAYFEQQVADLEGQLERDIRTKEDWLANKNEYRRQLAEMLGLDPMPARTELKPAVTATFEHEGIVVENLHYQASPGLYVTGNLYRPKVVGKPLPTILYVCGHSTQMKNGISYGNKSHYEHHGVWYAKHGFVCLVIDTVELGEIRGEHHGTYSKGRLWWWSRGYTPAGCEAWQGIRALDYLETRPEVDKTRFGVTGRSGGGAYSWYIAALDERIKCAAPTAGITTLRNHVVDGCVEGHCDCMFMVNTYRWDYDKVAALVAPRALCIVNTDKDRIFPIDGVMKIYQGTRRIYKLLGAENSIGLQIAEGPHADTQPLNTGEFHWMTRFLQGADSMSTLDSPAVHSIPMEKLRVFATSGAGVPPASSATGILPVAKAGTGKMPTAQVSGGTPEPQAGLPADERNTRIDESLVPLAAEAKVPQTGDEWVKHRDGWMKAAREKSFGGWRKEIDLPKTAAIIDTDILIPDAGDSVRKQDEPPKPKAESSSHGSVLTWRGGEVDGLALQHAYCAIETPLDLFVVHRANVKLHDLELVVLNVLDEQGWQEFVNTYAHKFPKLFPEGTKATPEDKAFEQEKKMFENFKWGMAYVCPRGIGPTAWDSKETPADDKAAAAAEKSRVQRLRRFYLLGQTLEGQQVWDVRCAIRALRSIEGLKDTKLWLQASRTQAANSLMASLFEDNIARLDLHELPHSLMPTAQDKLGHPVTGAEPAYLNMLRFLDLPQAAAMAAERTRVVIYDNDKAAWNYPAQVSEKLGWGKDKKNGLQLRDVPKGS
jgi:dienelactone hydrolase